MPYNRGIIVPEIADIHGAFDRLFVKLAALERDPRIANDMGRAQRDLRVAYLRFNRGLNALASNTAGVATRRIKYHLRQTSRRADTQKKPHLRDHIRSRRLPGGPLATGIVQIADEDELNKVVNPFSPRWGPYWRAQELGIDFSGREIRGFFAGPGGTPFSPPQGRYRGVAGAPDPIFRARAKGPAGTIQTPIKARHFIRDGARDARNFYQTSLGVLIGEASSAIGRAEGDVIRAFARL